VNLNFEFRAVIPGGIWRDGACVREARLRPLTGDDEAFLLDAGDSFSPAARTTALLSRCLVGFGELEKVTPGLVRALTVGDREALLLHLRRITYGDSLPCVLVCPGVGCGAKMDLDMKVSDLLLPAYENSQESYECDVTANGADYHVRFRLPNGADQELAADRSFTDFHAAERLVLKLCVERISGGESEIRSDEEWPLELADRIGAKMAELDPQAEILLQLRCPECQHEFSAEFDAAAYFYQELRGRLPHLYQEVHQIAHSYHWSESEILDMTPRKRMVYLNLLAGEGEFE
jgi:hypothetical protein